VPGGIEEDRGSSYVEFAIYGPPGELPELPDLEAVAGEGVVEITSTEIPDDWADRWRGFHTAIEVGGRLQVRPSWIGNDRAGEPADVDIVIDPGRAFGTGGHASTRLCMELAEEIADRPEAEGSVIA
jgi:ribosomal protein L11 methyltransferase